MYKYLHLYLHPGAGALPSPCALTGRWRTSPSSSLGISEGPKTWLQTARLGHTSRAICTNINTPTYIYIYVFKYLYLCVLVYIYVHIHIYLCMCIYLCVCVRMFLYVFVYVYVYVSTLGVESPNELNKASPGVSLWGRLH